MGYGGSVGHSWVVLVPFAIAVAIRMFGSGRRRAGGPPRHRPVPGTASSLTDPSVTSSGLPSPSPGHAEGAAPRDIGKVGIAPGWLVDPTGRHELRYWSGREWTEHVTDAGVPGVDPPPGRRGTNGAP